MGPRRSTVSDAMRPREGGPGFYTTKSASLCSPCDAPTLRKVWVPKLFTQKSFDKVIFL